jgi:hypothetical protein
VAALSRISLRRFETLTAECELIARPATDEAKREFMAHPILPRVGDRHHMHRIVFAAFGVMLTSSFAQSSAKVSPCDLLAQRRLPLPCMRLARSPWRPPAARQRVRYHAFQLRGGVRVPDFAVVWFSPGFRFVPPVGFARQRNPDSPYPHQHTEIYRKISHAYDKI